MPLAASIDEPPPTATKPASAGAPAEAIASAPAARSSVVGLACTPLKTVDVTPASARLARTASMTGVASMPVSVMITALAPPAAAASGPSLLMPPAAKCADGVGAITSSVLARPLITLADKSLYSLTPDWGVAARHSANPEPGDHV